MRVLHVVGARPNFMKAAPVMAAIGKRSLASQIIVHTGQHYDANMSEIFFKQLGLPPPDIHLGVGSGSHAYQTAQMMMRIERVLLDTKPDLVLVYGDFNSTASAAIVCTKLLIPVAHVEAGLRSFARTMPEEINRLITDQISDLLFTPSKDSDENLVREGVAKDKIHFVGNVMIDSLLSLLPKVATDAPWCDHSLAKTAGRNAPGKAGLPQYHLPELQGRRGRHRQTQTDPQIMQKKDASFALVTLHRPSNVDKPDTLGRIIGTLEEISNNLPVIFPIHPRTMKRITEYELKIAGNGNLHLIDPVGYLDFLALQRKATVVITDSGGIQEETTFLGVPCLTVRENTERPVTTELGTNILVGQDMERLRDEVHRILEGKAKRGSVPPLWDGKASERIANVIAAWG